MTPTCSTHFAFGAEPQQKNASREQVYTHAHAQADNAPLSPYAPVHAHVRRRSVSVHEEPHDLPYEFTAREKQSLGVRAHLHRLWRGLVKKSAPRLVLVRR